MLSCILFDLDGTLVDSYEAITECLNAARAAFRLPLYSREEVLRMVGHGLEQLMEEAVGRSRVAEGVRIFRERYQRVSLPKTRLLDGVRPTLEALRSRGYRMGVVSNKPAYFSRRILDHLEVSSFLPVVYGPDVAPAKPDPTMAFRAIVDLGATPETTVLVGDMSVDRDTARNAGLRFYAIATGSESRESLLAGRPDRFLERFDDLLQCFPPLPGNPVPAAR